MKNQAQALVANGTYPHQQISANKITLSRQKLKSTGEIREMKTVKLSSVFYEMAREQTKKRQFRKIEDYIETLIRNDYENKNSRP